MQVKSDPHPIHALSLTFNSHEERMQHPQAKLIPVNMWENFFHRHLNETSLALMCSSSDLLENCLTKTIPHLSSYVEKKAAWFSMALSHPELKFSFLQRVTSQIFGLDNYNLFSFLAELGNVTYIQKCLANFTHAVIVEYIQRNDFRICQTTVFYGQINVLKFFESIIPNLIREIIANEFQKQNIDSLYMYAAFNGHLDILKYIESKASDCVQAMISSVCTTFDPFKGAARQKHLDICNHILNQSSACFAYAEMHTHEYAHIITPFITMILTTLHQESESELLLNPNGVFNIQEGERARLCFYLVRNLIRRNDRNLDDELRFLLNIPSVKALAHQELTPGNSNELLRLAMSLGNREAASLLLNIEAVRRLAEENNFYREEVQNGIDFRRLAQDRESSMIALTEGEAQRLEKAISHYQPRIQSAGIQTIMQELKNELIKRYLVEPALIIVNEKALSLPLSFKDFQLLKLTENERQEALVAYYKHPAHTALRYLSKPNPWMHEQASYVYINDELTERWSTFEEYQPLIALTYLAATDREMQPSEKNTVESRFHQFINELALIGRAHNWDKSRIRDGKTEEFDDLEGDRPSCFSGVKRRLFQSVIDHPFFEVLTDEKIEAEIRLFVFEHFKSILTPKNMHQFKTIFDEVFGIEDTPTDKNVAQLGVFNIPSEKQNNFILELKKKYGTQFDESKCGLVLDTLKLNPEATDSRFRYHVMKLYDLSGFYSYLASLCSTSPCGEVLAAPIEINQLSSLQEPVTQIPIKTENHQRKKKPAKIFQDKDVIDNSISNDPSQSLQPGQEIEVTKAKANFISQDAIHLTTKSNRVENCCLPNNMQILGGFIASLGIVTVAIAFTVLSSGIIPVACIGVATIIGGLGLFAKGCFKESQESTQDLVIADRQICL